MKPSGLVIGAIAALSSLSCAGAVESSKMEDRARRTVPVPICIQPLERSTSGVSKVEPADYWRMVLPSFDAGSSTVDAGAQDCAGRAAFSEQELLGAEGPRAGSLPAKPDHAVVTPGPDGFRVVWLRTFEFSDGSSAGPLALVRSREGYAEVYGTGTLRSRLKTTRFSLERMGSRILVTATDEGCGEVKPGQGCETAFTVYVLGGGRLTRAAALPLDRIDYRPFPGLPGLSKYRLTATPVFQDKGMRVVEQVLVQDPNQGTVRKSDLERLFKLAPSGKLEASVPSLWTQVAGGDVAAPHSAGPALDEPKPTPPKAKPNR
ncbi:MAG: hypothetical protein EOO73_08980 [Myxococcales bacterium]|nr:MAG: hypothetical protein EOO73_08980 [Myxococcales bacterium]